MERAGGRAAGHLRPVHIRMPSFLKYPEGAALVEMGDTIVICTASVEEKVPPFLRGKGRGWVTAEYGMLPRSTVVRSPREAARGHVGGRSQEIQRLIGRSLRAVVDLVALGERTIWIDCDVIQADGGTRTASISGGFVALVQALQHLADKGDLAGGRDNQGGRAGLPVTGFLAAVSVGKVAGEILLDLDYAEDSRAEVDMNIVMTGDGRLVEIQGTAEEQPFAHAELEEMLMLARAGIVEIIHAQALALGELAARVGGGPQCASS